MNVSGILVVTRPEWVAELCRALDAIDGVEVHHVEDGTGRLIATIEAPTVRGEVALMERVKAVPGVALAELVTHYFADEAPGEPPSAVPAFLND